MICKHKWTKLNSSKYYYISPAIQLNISHLFTCNSKIKPIDRTLSGAISLGQIGPRNNGKEGCIPHSSKVQHYWSLTIKLFSVISRTLIQRWNVLPLCREVVVILYSPSWLDHRTLLGGGGVLLLCREAISVFFNPSEWATGHPLWGVLPLCREAVNIFYSPN